VQRSFPDLISYGGDIIARWGQACRSLADFLDAWQQHGPEALTKTATESPAMFVRVAASLLPRHFKMEHDFEGMTDAQLDKYIGELNAAIADELRASAGVGEGGTRAAAAGTQH
jgi:hypothetical protein